MEDCLKCVEPRFEGTLFCFIHQQKNYSRGDKSTWACKSTPIKKEKKYNLVFLNSECEDDAVSKSEIIYKFLKEFDIKLCELIILETGEFETKLQIKCNKKIPSYLLNSIKKDLKNNMKSEEYQSLIHKNVSIINHKKKFLNSKNDTK